MANSDKLGMQNFASIARRHLKNFFSNDSQINNHQEFKARPFQSSRCDPYWDNVTWPRTTLPIIYVFLLLSCPGMPGHEKVLKINVLFATLYKMEDS